MNATPTLFEDARMTMDEAIDLTVQSLNEYRARYDHWAMAYSGGKDSSELVTLVTYLIESGRVERPKSLKVLYADTRMELPPLQATAMQIMNVLAERGVESEIVLPEMDDRFFVYILGRGVPPPKNRFRWCTSQLKIEPMQKALQAHRAFVGEKLLMLTGVRLGESAARDARIVLSCSRDGSECGQGYFQESTKEAVADTLAPIIHHRVCHVADWLGMFAPAEGFPTLPILETYGVDFIEGSVVEIAARTGCIQCNLVSTDHVLINLCKKILWAYLKPLLGLKPIYEEMKRPEHRLRKWGETKKDGSLAANQGRLGPLTLEARKYFLEQILHIQNQVNTAAANTGRPIVSLIDDDEHRRILELIRLETYPEKWTGEEMRGDEMTDKIFRDGTIQPWMFN